MYMMQLCKTLLRLYVNWWWNVHGEPVECVSLAREGEIFLLDDIITESHKYELDDFQELANNIAR